MGLGSALLGAAKFAKPPTTRPSLPAHTPKTPSCSGSKRNACSELGNSAEAMGALFTSLESPRRCRKPRRPRRRAAPSNVSSKQHCLTRSTPTPSRPRPRTRPSWPTSCSTSSAATKRWRSSTPTSRPISRSLNAAAPLLLPAARSARTTKRWHPPAWRCRPHPATTTSAPASAMALLAHGELTPEAWNLYESRTSVLGMAEWPTPAAALARSGRGRPDRARPRRARLRRHHQVRPLFAPMLAARGARGHLGRAAGLAASPARHAGADTVSRGRRGPARRSTGICRCSACPGCSGPRSRPSRRRSRCQVAAPPALPAPHRAGISRSGWSGAAASPSSTTASARSDPAALAPLASVAGVTFYSLQFAATDLPLPGMIDPCRASPISPTPPPSSQGWT